MFKIEGQTLKVARTWLQIENAECLPLDYIICRTIIDTIRNKRTENNIFIDLKKKNFPELTAALMVSLNAVQMDGTPVSVLDTVQRISSRIKEFQVVVVSHTRPEPQQSSVKMEDVLLCFIAFGCNLQIDFNAQTIIIKCPAERQSPEVSELHTLVLHLIQQAYYFQEFRLEALVSDLFWMGLSFTSFRPREGTRLTNEQLQQIKGITRFNINGLHPPLIAEAIKSVLSIQHHQEEFNLQQRDELYIVNPPYSVKTPEELETALERFTIKQSKLTQLGVKADNLALMAERFIFKEEIKVEIKDCETFTVEGETFFQKRAPFKFAVANFDQRQRKEYIKPEVAQYIRENSRLYRALKDEKIEKDEAPKADSSSKKDKWINVHMKDEKWYADKLKNVGTKK